MSRGELTTNIVMATAAVIVTAAVVLQRFENRPLATVSPGGAPVRLADPNHWDQMLALGRIVNDSGARTQMVVFSDYEWPACRAFHTVFKDFAATLPGALEVRIVHMPLDYHRFAEPSARFAECAASEGAFARATNVLFDLQDSLGLLGWTELAQRAGVRDPQAVAACVSESRDDPRFGRIVAGTRLAQEIQARGTPTVVIDGLVYGGVPSRSDLEKVVNDASGR